MRRTCGKTSAARCGSCRCRTGWECLDYKDGVWHNFIIYYVVAFWLI